MKPIEEILGSEAQRLFPAGHVTHLGGNRYVIFPGDAAAAAKYPQGYRWLADEGDGSGEEEEGFAAAWEESGA